MIWAEMQQNERRRTRRWRALAGALGLVGASVLVTGGVGCSPTGPERNTGGSGATGVSGSGATSGGSSNVSGNSSGGTGVMIPVGGTSAGGAGNMDCAATSTSAELIPLDLYVMMDSSKSMTEPTAAGVTKWKSVVDAMVGFFQDPNSAGLSVGLKYFPDEQPSVPESCTDDTQCAGFGVCQQRKACVANGTFTKTVTQLCTTAADCAATETCESVQRCADGAECRKVYCVSSGATAPCTSDCVPFGGYCEKRDICTAANYATPAVAFGNLPEAAPGLTASITARMPGGYTPTGPALAGAIQQAQERARANPDHKVAVVLVTDGLPGGFIPGSPPAECTPGDIAGVASLVAAGAMGTPPIPTFVIGVFGPCDLVDANVMPQANLDTLAKAGATDKAVVISTNENVTQQLQAALKQVRSSAIACQYAIPKPAEGTLNYTKVNVTFSSGASGTNIVGHVPTDLKADCDPTLGGWYYDKDPKLAVPTQIIACDQSCMQFQLAQDARVDIALGCDTVPIR